MAGIYIKDIKFPAEGQVLRVSIDPRGGALCSFGSNDIAGTQAIPVPPHGRLIDADATRADIDEKRPGRSYEDAWALTVLDNAPTILEAEEGE